MGYYTDYTLTIVSKSSLRPSDFINGKYEWPLDDLIKGGSAYEAKWYSHNADMADLSKEYPQYVFQLDGIGEDYPDIWRKFYKNGKMVKHAAKIEFPEFSENDLE